MAGFGNSSRPGGLLKSFRPSAPVHRLDSPASYPKAGFASPKNRFRFARQDHRSLQHDSRPTFRCPVKEEVNRPVQREVTRQDADRPSYCGCQFLLEFVISNVAESGINCHEFRFHERISLRVRSGRRPAFADLRIPVISSPACGPNPWAGKTGRPPPAGMGKTKVGSPATESVPMVTYRYAPSADQRGYKGGRKSVFGFGPLKIRLPCRPPADPRYYRPTPIWRHIAHIPDRDRLVENTFQTRSIRFDPGKVVDVRSQLPKNQFARTAETDVVSATYHRARWRTPIQRRNENLLFLTVGP